MKPVIPFISFLFRENLGLLLFFVIFVALASTSRVEFHVCQPGAVSCDQRTDKEPWKLSLRIGKLS